MNFENDNHNHRIQQFERVNKYFSSQKTVLHSNGSQGGQVGYTPDIYPGSTGLTPAPGNQQK